MKRLLVILVGVSCGLGCDSVECGQGTHQDGNACVSSLPVPCGVGTELRNGSCQPVGGGGGECGPGTHLEGGACVPNLGALGNAARMFTVSVSAPSALGAIANDPLAQSFMTGESLMFVGVYRPQSMGLRVWGGTGTPEADGSYRLDRTDSHDVTGQPGFTTAPFTYSFHALGAEPIILEETTITGRIEEVNGVELVISGEFSGILTRPAADRVFIDLANSTLGQLLDNVGAMPDVDRDNDGTPEAWTMTGQFEAEPVWVF